MIEIVTELQALAQTGIAYSKDEYDIGRYERILEISAELLSPHSNYSYEDIIELFTKDSGYATPKIDVRGAVFKDSKLLHVREKSDGLWSMPGGWADVNLSPSENVLKEIKEETGYQCKVTKLIGVYDKKKSNRPGRWPHVYKIFFMCELIDALRAPLCDEILETGFFKLEKIPPLSEGRVSRYQVEKSFIYYNTQKLETYFE
ncbi:MAG: NUDIX hydrolase [Candidatus Paracaedibacter sp.]